MPEPDGFFALLDESASALYESVLREGRRYAGISAISDAAKRETRLKTHYDRMLALLERVCRTGNPALMMGVEYSMLQRDRQHLKTLARSIGLDRFLKADLTGNEKGLEAVGRALGALAYQSENPRRFHEVMRVGSDGGAFDAQMLVVDIVRGAARKQSLALQNEMRGLHKTELERKRRDFLVRRHENMSACENIYKAIQRGAKKDRG